MNYLAHLFLADDDPESLIGALMGDFAKGRIAEDLAPGIRWGIRMHRKIDAFTDAHTVVRRSKHRLRTEYRRYGGILIDLYYDHFLALHWSRFATVPLEEFATDIYRLLDCHRERFPVAMQRSVTYMVAHDLLPSYREIGGIRRALHGIESRLKRPSRLGAAVVDLEVNYQTLETDFFTFFPELISFVGRLNSRRVTIEAINKSVPGILGNLKR